MNKFKYVLDIQLFAEEGPEETPPANQEIDYEKLAETISKRTSATEESALKGILKDKGVSKEEMEDAIKAYKESKSAKVKAEQERIDSIIKENTEFKNKEFMQSVKNDAKEIAKELKVRDDRFEKLMRLCDKGKFTDSEGKFDKEATKAEMEEQLKDVPEFKSNKNIVITASKGADVPPAMTDEEEFRRQKYGKSRYFKN